MKWVHKSFARLAATPIQQLAPVLLPVVDEHIVEVFSNVAVTRWFHLTPDLQFLAPALEQTLPPGAKAIYAVVVVGMCAKVDF